MDCGDSAELACRVLAWFRQIGLDVASVGGLLRAIWLTGVDVVRAILGLVSDYGEKIFGALGFSFGIWRWWYTRERVLHRRLQEYIHEQDGRLRDARSYVLEALSRPGERRRFAEPLFAVRPLRDVLRRRNWAPILGFVKVERGAQQKLDRSIADIERRLGTTGAALTSLRAQMATAYILKGAIAAARAPLMRDSARRIALDDEALTQFRTVMQVRDHDRDVQAKEYEAHQLRRLGNISEAADAYEGLEAVAASMSDERERCLVLARARMHRAHLTQVGYIREVEQGLRVTPICPIAHNLMTDDTNGVLALRRPYHPFHDWDAIEQGDCHYIAAFVCNKHGATNQEPPQLRESAGAYKAVLDKHPHRWVMPAHVRRLRAAALAGLKRVERVRQQGHYDTDWLLPPSNGAQEPSAAIGRSSG